MLGLVSLVLRSALDQVDTEVLDACGADSPELRAEARQAVEQLRSEFGRQLDTGNKKSNEQPDAEKKTGRKQ